MFSEEKIKEYADKLLIGLTDEENKLILDEFEEIDKNMNLINDIPNIKDVSPLSYPYDMEISALRSGKEVCEEIPIDKLLSNCGRYEGREVIVPKVVG